jgi:hypothetical protein
MLLFRYLLKSESGFGSGSVLEPDSRGKRKKTQKNQQNKIELKAGKINI